MCLIDLLKQVLKQYTCRMSQINRDEAHGPFIYNPVHYTKNAIN